MRKTREPLGTSLKGANGEVVTGQYEGNDRWNLT